MKAAHKRTYCTICGDYIFNRKSNAIYCKRHAREVHDLYQEAIRQVKIKLRKLQYNPIGYLRLRQTKISEYNKINEVK